MIDTCIRIPEAGIALLGIPKCACQSVWSAIVVALGHDVPEDPPRHPEIAARRCTSSNAQLDGLEVFALVRHPLDRLVSLWANKIVSRTSRGSLSMKRQGYTLGAPFGEFVRQVVPRRDDNQHTRPQTDFLTGHETLMRFEDLPSCWDVAQERWTALPELPRRNPSAHQEWREMYDERTLALAAELYARDLTELGYETDAGQ